MHLLLVFLGVLIRRVKWHWVATGHCVPLEANQSLLLQDHEFGRPCQQKKRKDQIAVGQTQVMEYFREHSKLPVLRKHYSPIVRESR